MRLIQILNSFINKEIALDIKTFFFNYYKIEDCFISERRKYFFLQFQEPKVAHEGEKTHFMLLKKKNLTFHLVKKREVAFLEQPPHTQHE